MSDLDSDSDQEQIKALEKRIDGLAMELSMLTFDMRSPRLGLGSLPNQRWVSIGITDLQTGIAALRRSISPRCNEF